MIPGAIIRANVEWEVYIWLVVSMAICGGFSVAYLVAWKQAMDARDSRDRDTEQRAKEAKRQAAARQKRQNQISALVAKGRKKMEHNVTTAIARAISHNEIVTITPRKYRDTMAELEQLCTGSTILAQYGEAEYWGVHEGDGWRVHVVIDVEAVVADWLTDHSTTSLTHGLAVYCDSWDDWDEETLAYELSRSIVQDLDDLPLGFEALETECLRVVTKYQENARTILANNA